MNIETFKASTEAEKPPDGLSVPLKAMWYQGKGNWEEAHRLAQSENSPNGNLGNAAYWYRLADRPVCTSSLDDEWAEIVTALVQENPLEVHN